MSKRYEDLAMQILLNTLKAGKNEEILIVADETTLTFGEAYRSAASGLGLRAALLIIPLTQTDGSEPMSVVSAGMLSSDIVIAVSRYSLTHCKATKEAREKGVRLLSIPNINESIFLSRAMDLSEKEKADTVRASELFTIGETVRVTTRTGTDLSFKAGGWDRIAGVDNAVIDKPGTTGNLPAGEALIVPMRGTGNGVVVADTSVSGGLGILEAPIRINIKDGIVVSVEGGDKAKALEKIFDNSGENSRNLAEFAIGLNNKAEIIGAMVMDEKLMGTAHIGIGNSECLGGDVYANSHIDALFRNPTIEIDDEYLAEDGELYLGEKKYEDYRNYPQDDIKGKICLIPDTAVIKEGVLHRKWKEAFGKTYFMKVGVSNTAETVREYYEALASGEPVNEKLNGQKEINKLNRLLLRYGIISLQ